MPGRVCSAPRTAARRRKRSAKAPRVASAAPARRAASTATARYAQPVRSAQASTPRPSALPVPPTPTRKTAVCWCVTPVPRTHTPLPGAAIVRPARASLDSSGRLAVTASNVRPTPSVQAAQPRTRACGTVLRRPVRSTLPTARVGQATTRRRSVLPAAHADMTTTVPAP